jgi:AcrR family transcriptional regulator
MRRYLNLNSDSTWATVGGVALTARGSRTRETLVAAARTVFERDGYRDAKIADISAEAGVATGSFYTYFQRKEDVFAAVMEQLQEETLHPRLVEAADPEDPVAVIEAANRAYLQTYRRNAKLMALLEEAQHLDPDVLALRLRRARLFAQRNARAIRKLQQRGLCDQTVDPLLTAHAISAMVSRTAYMTFVQGELKTSMDELVRTLTRLWAGAIGLDLKRS